MAIYSNQPLEDLSDDNDLIGTLPKAKAIKLFLESNMDAFCENRMIALYGNWGSGKTTVMKYLAKEIDKKNYRPIFFEPWKHEKDGNLAISLLEALTDDLKNLSSEPFVEVISDVFEKGKKLFKGMIKSTSLTIALSPDGPGVTINPKEILDEFEPKPEGQTYYTKEKEFRVAFCKIEESIADYAKLSKTGRIIVFIDDLDRCDPDSVVELLSMIKLFFTYGNRTIFFCGLDKEAVNEAVSRKYVNVIKSEEYLEKIYDISFNMIESNDIQKLIKKQFHWDRSVDDERKSNLSKALTVFFEEMEFTNPRHVKKVLNKYQIIKSFKKNANKLASIKLVDLIPDIIDDEEGGNYFDTVLVLYIIILFEFKRKLFGEIESIEKKIAEYAKGILGTQQQRGTKTNYNTVLDNLNAVIGKQIEEFETVEKIKEKRPKLLNPSMTDQTNIDHQILLGFYCRFLPPYTSNNIAIDNGLPVRSFIKQFQSTSSLFTVNFCLYLDKNRWIIFEEKASNYKLERIFQMAKTLL